jgi:hypothetical protein
VSLSSAFEAPTATVAAATTGAAPQNRRAITAEALNAAWEKYMAANPKAHLLINTMRVHRPELNAAQPAGATQHQQGAGTQPQGASPQSAGANGAAPEMLKITVINPGQVDLLNQERPALLAFLRRELSNDYIDFTLELNENVETPTAWSDKDVLFHLVDQNPQLAAFIKDFKLTLA